MLEFCVSSRHKETINISCTAQFVTSRDATKKRFLCIKQVLKSVENRWHYCDAPLNLVNFDLNFYLVFEPHVHIDGKAASFIFFVFQDKFWSFFCVFWIVVSVISLGQKTKN